jgi:hypothetical protein
MAGGTKRDKKKAANNTLKKGRKLKKMVNKAQSGSMKYDNIDVKTIEDVGKLVEHIKNNVVTLMLIYADWCGHCGPFKEGIWKKLAGMKNRKVAMAQVNEKMLEHVKNHIPNLKIDGYPTNVLVGKDMTPATMTDAETGEPTNALPNTRDMASMTKLVTADPAEVVANNGLSEINEAPSSSASPTPEANTARNNSGNETLENVNSGKPLVSAEQSNPVPNPPNVEDDLLTASQVTSDEQPRAKPNSAATVGGSLYAALLEAAGELAVPVGLTAAAVSLTSRKNKHKRRGTAKKLRARARK